jgi:hypothetical protein
VTEEHSQQTKEAMRKVLLKQIRQEKLRKAQLLMEIERQRQIREVAERIKKEIENRRKS